MKRKLIFILVMIESSTVPKAGKPGDMKDILQTEKN